MPHLLAVKACFLLKEFARPYSTIILDVHETLQIRHNYFQGVDRELHRFLKCIQTKKIVEICSFGLVWEYFSWNLNKTEVAQYFKSIMLWN